MQNSNIKHKEELKILLSVIKFTDEEIFDKIQIIN